MRATRITATEIFLLRINYFWKCNYFSGFYYPENEIRINDTVKIYSIHLAGAFGR